MEFTTGHSAIPDFLLNRRVTEDQNRQVLSFASNTGAMHHTDAAALGTTGTAAGKPPKTNWRRFKSKLTALTGFPSAQAQIRPVKHAV